jgi:endonuclease/exonuclease/phosphatase (EEP) superfamily protein YafD
MSKVALTLHLKPVNFTEEDEESLKYAVLSLPLDHIFYNKLSEKRARVLSHISSSDHKPIFVEFN